MSFSEVDASPQAAVMMAALDNIARLPAVQRLKTAALTMLAPAAGQRLADVGSGTGEDVRLLGEKVGPSGRVIGIEPSSVMLAEAQRRHGDAGLPIEFRQGDAMTLGLEDASVDGVRSERVFQHLADPAAAMAELARVTKPGGRIVVIDSDWGMHAVHGGDPVVTFLILQNWSNRTPTGWAGRRLPALFNGIGISNPEIVADTFVLRDPDRPTGPPFTLMADAAVEGGAVTAGEAETWLADLVEAGRRNEFFWALTMFAVGGTRP